MVVDEVSAWETYERATSKQARQLSSAYRRRSVQADDGGVVRRQSRHRHSIPVLGPTHALAGIGIKELEEAADKADAERVAARRSYSTQFSHFFDTLDSDREDALGSIEEDLVKKDLSPSVQENLLSIFSVYFEKHIHFEERQRKRNDDSTLKSVLKKIDGTMPGCQSYILNRLPLPHVVLFVELCLRGIGQGVSCIYE
jgi:signal recognition particle GTPase